MARRNNKNNSKGNCYTRHMLHQASVRLDSSKCYLRKITECKGRTGKDTSLDIFCVFEQRS